MTGWRSVLRAVRWPFMSDGVCDWCGEEVPPVWRWKLVGCRARGLLRLCDACGDGG